MNKMLKTLARRSFRAGKLRNFIAVLAIMLTAVLFTAVTTIALSALDSMTLTQQMAKGSRSDGDLRNMTKEQFEALDGEAFIDTHGLRMPVAFLTNTNRLNIEFDVLDEAQAALTFCTPSHGRAPEAENEVVASDAALRDLGVEPEVGAVVPVAFSAHGKTYEMELVVSGWYEAVNAQMSVMWAGEAFVNAHPDIFTYTYDVDGDVAGTYWCDFTATSTSNLQTQIDDWVRENGGDPDDVSAGGVVGVVNQMTNPTVAPQTIAMGAVVVVLFIFCGYLLIYNVFDIAVMQDIRRYGLYRTVGMSRRQVKMLINRQAFWLSCIGIPLGLVVGYFVGKAALPVTMDILQNSYDYVALDVSPSPAIFAGAAVLSALTVFLSTRKPVRVAANIPPIEAFRYVENTGGRKKRKRSNGGVKLSHLAWANLGRNKRRTAFIVTALTLCVVFLNSVGIAADSVDIEKQVDYTIRTDFALVNAVSTNGMEGFTRRDQGLTQAEMDAIDAQPGVSDASAVYKNTLDDLNVTYDFPLEVASTDFDEESGLMRALTPENLFLNLGDDGHPLCNVYGMSEAAIARLDIREGETDAHKLYAAMQRGEGVLVGTELNRYTMEIEPIFDLLDVGDVITVYKDGEAVMTLPVLAKAAINGDDQEVGYTTNGASRVGCNAPSLYMPTSIYTELYDDPAVYKYSFNVAEGDRDAMTAFLENYVTQEDTRLNYVSAEDARDDATTIRTMIRFVGGLIGVIFGLAGVLNFVNTTITSILARRHEFATMQSIGMTRRQLQTMMIWEGVYYALGAAILGLALSAILAFTVVRGLLASVWYFTFHFTLVYALATSLVLLALAAVVPVIALKCFNRGSVVEKLRVAE